MIYDHFSGKKTSKAGDSMNRVLNKKIAGIISKICGPRKRILEIGPGQGLFMQSILAKGYSYTGIEPNKALAGICRGISKQAVIINSSVPPIKAQDSSFDAVFAGSVLEHFMDYKEAGKAFQESARVLRKDGHLVLFFPDYLDWGKDFFDADYSHSFVTTLNRARNLLADMRFEIVRRTYFNGSFTGFERILLSPLFFAWNAVISILKIFSDKEIVLKAGITFHRNILLVARRKKG